MPANLSPEYKAAEAAFRRARDPRDRLEGLREMLRTMPKHKGTDHLQADIKSRIKELSEEIEGPKKGGASRTGPALVIRPEGAAQIALLGPPNSGKSSLHARLTGSGAHVADYPFTTQYPEPGMMPFEDIRFQLVDLPAVSPDHPVPWLAGTLQTADACLLVVDLNDAACMEQVETLHAVLKEKRVTLSERWNGDSAPTVAGEDDPFALRLPTLLVATKADLETDPEAEVQTFEELEGLRYPALAVSATTGKGLDRLGPWLFRSLGVARVYTKLPGKPADKERPFTLRRGQTVEDVAKLVHKDVAQSLKYARVWNSTGFDGQQVGREHAVTDGEVIELHT
ncbi:MAG: 50S ribosome-binding GTPase [Betaproteobacteria bacterium]|nr:50S ribosome-binding GTPase [Betaproteobacteria bacterium]